MKRVAENMTSFGWLSDSAIKLRNGTILDINSKTVLKDAAHVPEKLSVKNVQWRRMASSWSNLPDVEFYRMNNMPCPTLGAVFTC